MALVKLPDGNTKELPDGSTVRDLAAAIGPRLAQAALVGKVDGKLVDLSHKLTGEHQVQIITERDPEGLLVLRHSAAHVMAEAIQRIWPNAKLAYGPPLENGYYYDIALDSPISTADFPRIEAEMKKIVEEDRPFTRYDLKPDVAFKKLKAEGNKYKIDNAQRALSEKGANTLSWYVTGEPTEDQFQGKLYEPGADSHPSVSATANAKVQDGLRKVFGPVWEDLCMGPHVPSTGRIKAFKIMSVAQSHWHGDIAGDKFQRIYGTAFHDKKQLEEHLKQLEEAKKRDHRFLGPQLGLFTIDDAVGQGLVLWKPKGAVIRQELQNFISEHLRRQGYQQVFTPHIGRLSLYKTSGHYPYYRESQFPRWSIAS